MTIRLDPCLLVLFYFWMMPFFEGVGAELPLALQWTLLGDSSTAGKNGSSTPWPVPRQSFSMAFDGRRQRWYLYSGSEQAGQKMKNDLMVFHLENRTWDLLSGIPSQTDISTFSYGLPNVPSATNLPPGRRGSALVVDPDTGLVYLFGGSIFGSPVVRLNDLWIFDTATTQWTWLMGGSVVVSGHYGTYRVASPANLPPGRSFHCMHLFKGSLVVFGGFAPVTGTGTLLNDVWVFGLMTGMWTWVHGSSSANSGGNSSVPEKVATGLGTPGARTYLATDVDSETGRMYVFGGRLPSGLSDNEFWYFDVNVFQWTLVHAAQNALTFPPAIYLASLTVNHQQNLVIFFSGAVTWTFSMDSQQWKKPTMLGTPGTSRVGARTAWADDANIFLLYGGQTVADTSVNLGDMRSATFLFPSGSKTPGNASQFGVFIPDPSTATAFLSENPPSNSVVITSSLLSTSSLPGNKIRATTPIEYPLNVQLIVILSSSLFGFFVFAISLDVYLKILKNRSIQKPADNTTVATSYSDDSSVLSIPQDAFSASSHHTAPKISRKQTQTSSYISRFQHSQTGASYRPPSLDPGISYMSSAYESNRTAVNSVLPMALPGHLHVCLEQDVHLDQLVATGGFSQIFRASVLASELMERCAGETKVAVKVIDMSSFDLETSEANFIHEVSLMQELVGQPHFVQLKGFSWDPMAIIMTLHELGDFGQLIHSRLQHAYSIPDSTQWTAAKIKPLLSDMIHAIHYLHQHQISHNDIKPANALLQAPLPTSPHPHQRRLHLVLTDFSVASMQHQEKRGVKALDGQMPLDGLSLKYAAPEVLQLLLPDTLFSSLSICLYDNTTGSSFQMMEGPPFPLHSRDSYAMGVVCLETIYRQLPWHQNDSVESVYRCMMQGERILKQVEGTQLRGVRGNEEVDMEIGVRGKEAREFPLEQELQGLMRVLPQCLHYNPHRRPTMSQLMKWSDG